MFLLFCLRMKITTRSGFAPQKGSVVLHRVSIRATRDGSNVDSPGWNAMETGVMRERQKQPATVSPVKKVALDMAGRQKT
ncbi:MAG TPA: hypothetical protein PLK12_15905 [Prolixibacteraceae bacterium]|nr:hypothetical protein [Prolixibacteraceae bacterium]